MWPVPLSNNQQLFVIENPPARVIPSNFDFPANANNRRFSPSFYTRKLFNGELVNRRWLVYSKSKDCVFCLCCKLFSDSNNKFSKNGFKDWKNISTLIREHETSSKHIESQRNLIEIENRLKRNQTIDKELEKKIDTEKAHWRGVLERLIAIVQFLAKTNMVFRGSEEKLHIRNNGNFLGLVELIAKFDPVLSEHVRRINNSEVHDHYLGKNTQNELIQLISDQVLDKIVTSIKKSKYFSVILDCTPDVSHQEQMTVVLRFVEISGESVEIVERFLGFLRVEETTGNELTEALLKKLKELGLSIADCRGQGYDNGSNMRGCQQGVQARVLRINKRAFFVPCGCHNLNLLLGDMAKSSICAQTLFGIVQQIYVLFSASTQRWQILKKHVQNFTVKQLSETRWECRVESIKALRFQIGDVYDALVDVSETTKDLKCRTEAFSLAKELKSFKFLVMLSVWYDILAQVNIVSKMMQSANMQIDQALLLLQKTNEFLINFKENGFRSAQVTAKQLSEELEMNPEEAIFPDGICVRRKRVKKHFSYEDDE